MTTWSSESASIVFAALYRITVGGYSEHDNAAAFDSGFFDYFKTSFYSPVEMLKSIEHDTCTS